VSSGPKWMHDPTVTPVLKMGNEFRLMSGRPQAKSFPLKFEFGIHSEKSNRPITNFFRAKENRIRITAKLEKLSAQNFSAAMESGNAAVICTEEKDIMRNRGDSCFVNYNMNMMEKEDHFGRWPFLERRRQLCSLLCRLCDSEIVYFHFLTKLILTYATTTS
jgi:hypothetical protein